MRLVIALFRLLPDALARAFMRALATLAFALGIRRRVALENLAVAFPELSDGERLALAKKNFLHLGTCGADFLRSPSWSDEALFARVRADGWDKVEPLLRERRGFIVCTAHLGNFELFGAYASRRGAPLTILTRRLKGGANAQWTGTRGLSGVREIHSGMTALIKTVRDGGALALLIDQNMLPKRAVFAPFFGKAAATTPAPAVIAERTGAPVFLACMLAEGDGYRTVIEGPFAFERRGKRDDDVVRFMVQLNGRLEDIVRAHPEQWFWVHRRFKTRPPEESAARPAALPNL